MHYLFFLLFFIFICLIIFIIIISIIFHKIDQLEKQIVKDEDNKNTRIETRSANGDLDDDENNDVNGNLDDTINNNNIKEIEENLGILSDRIAVLENNMTIN